MKLHATTLHLQYGCNTPSPKQITEQLWQARQAASTPAAFDLRKVLFEQQLPFGLDVSRYQTAVTPRRAGKTYAIAAKLLKTALEKPGCVALYITLSRINASRIVWETLKEMNRSFALGGEVRAAELCIALPNGARVYLSGAADRGEVEKFRGLPIGIVILDEAQSFPAYIEQLVDEVLVPALTDFAGTLALVGTPGPVPVGYFHDKVTSPQWSHHGWSVFDNHHLERKSGRTTQSLLEDELRRRGVTAEDPIIQREWFGRWVLDVNSLVFRYDATRNHRTPRQHQHHVIGLDFGYDDADAIAVLGWSDDAPCVELVFEHVMAKQGITPLIEQVRAAYEKYKPLAVVADTGGLGKKVAEELQTRTSIPIEAADKQRKLEHIEWLNDALRTGAMYAPSTSRFAQDCMLVEWDKSNPEKPKVSARFHSDVCDAVLYAYVRALHWLHEPPKAPPPAINTPEWYAAEMARQQAEIEAQVTAQMERNRGEQQQSEDPLAWL